MSRSLRRWLSNSGKALCLLAILMLTKPIYADAPFTCPLDDTGEVPLRYQFLLGRAKESDGWTLYCRIPETNSTRQIPLPCDKDEYPVPSTSRGWDEVEKVTRWLKSYKFEDRLPAVKVTVACFSHPSNW